MSDYQVQKSEVYVTIKAKPEHAEFIRITEDGALEIPLPVVRELSDWLKRFDMRPKNRGPIVDRKPWTPNDHR